MSHWVACHALFCLLNFPSDSIPFHENHGLVICSPPYVWFCCLCCCKRCDSPICASYCLFSYDFGYVLLCGCVAFMSRTSCHLFDSHFFCFAARVKMKVIYQIIDWPKPLSSFACSSLREVDKHLPSQCFPGSQTWLMEGCDAGPFESFQTRNSPRINLQTRHVNWLALGFCCLLCVVSCVSKSKSWVRVYHR